MLVSGVGIGEHYATPTWEDRGMLVRGPAILEVRAAARRLLKLNSFKDSEIPPVLRETPRCDTCRATNASLDDGDAVAASELGRALLVNNEPGFGAKQASVARAMLYTLSPPGNVIIVPDGLWLESRWAGMLAGAALRGCRVFIVAPALANAPSAGFPQMSRIQEVMLRLLEVRHEFTNEIKKAGGELRVGLYTAKEDVNDIVQQSRAVRAGMDRYPWLHDLVPLAPSVLAVLDSAPAVLERKGYRPFELGRDEVPRLPQLHRKTQFFADSAALARLASRPEWREVAIQAIIARALQAERGTKTGLYDDSVTTAGTAAIQTLLKAYSREPSASRQCAYVILLHRRHDESGPSRYAPGWRSVVRSVGHERRCGTLRSFLAHDAKYLDRDGSRARQVDTTVQQMAAPARSVCPIAVVMPGPLGRKSNAWLAASRIGLPDTAVGGA